MKLSAALFVYALLFTAGCRPQPTEKVLVNVEDGGAFPPSLAGTWKVQDSTAWEFDIEQDGTLSSIVHTIGGVRLKPGRVTEVPMIEGKGVFKPGQWTVKYSPRTNELSIEIILDHYRAQSGPQIVEGSSTDLFVGPVTIDGQQWEPQWFSFPKFVVSTNEVEGLELPVDYNDNPRALIFEKAASED